MITNVYGMSTMIKNSEFSLNFLRNINSWSRLDPSHWLNLDRINIKLFLNLLLSQRTNFRGPLTMIVSFYLGQVPMFSYEGQNKYSKIFSPICIMAYTIADLEWHACILKSITQPWKIYTGQGLHFWSHP